MRKALTILAATTLAFGVAACSKSEPANSDNASDNMLVPADENAAGGDMNATDANAMDANSMGGDANASNAM